MKDKRRKFSLVYILLCLILVGEIFLAVDIAAALNGALFNTGLAVAAALIALLALCVLRPFSRKTGIVLVSAVTVFWLAAVALPLVTWIGFSKAAAYEAPDNGKEEFFGGKSVMVIVPHEDDDICVFGCVAEEYLKYGSDVHIVYVTNGDYYGREKGYQRINEAIAGQSKFGVPEDKLIFMGYGDDLIHYLYMNEDDSVLVSKGGENATYGTESHPSFREGRPYKRSALLEDMKELLKEYSPDIIICSDLDSHGDHIAVSLFFEEAMGELLRENADYQPLVLKSFSYFTGYYGAEDFYDDINIRSAVWSDEIVSVQGAYTTENSFRVPVSADALSRSMLRTHEYTALDQHASQKAEDHAVSIINGDRMCWQRRTDSLCARAKLTASSGNTAYLNDFKIGDSHELSEKVFSSGIWAPQGEDMSVTVEFPQKCDIHSVVLYDAPDVGINVLDAEISLDNGVSVRTGALKNNGEANVYELNAVGVKSMTLRLLKTEGEGAGITELEVFENAVQKLPDYIKLADVNGSFAYDFLCDGEAEFVLFSTDAGLTLEDCSVECAGSSCTAELADGVLRVSCPNKNSECTVTVTSPDGRLSDSVHVARRSALINAGAAIEGYTYHHWKLLMNTVSYRIMRDFYHMLGGQNIIL